jgi:putative DNA primase/helicase
MGTDPTVHGLATPAQSSQAPHAAPAMSVFDGLPLIQRKACEYHDLGYFVIGIMPGVKRPLWDGNHGYQRLDDEEEARRILSLLHEGSNLAVGMPLGAIGIDWDTYGGKTGGTTRLELQAKAGRLPDTVYSTRRGRQDRDRETFTGIEFFALPEWWTANAEYLRLPSVLGPGVETIQYHERVAVTYPSVADGMEYHIYDAGGNTVDTLPPVDELPVLTIEWMRLLHSMTTSPRVDATGPRTLSDMFAEHEHGLIAELLANNGSQRSGARRRQRISGHRAYLRMGSSEAESWARTTIHGYDDDPNEFVARKVEAIVSTLAQPGASHHDTCRDSMWNLILLCAGDRRESKCEPGNPGLGWALKQLETAFVRHRTTEGNDDGAAEAERLIVNGIAKLRDQIDAGERVIADRMYGEGESDAALLDYARAAQGVDDTEGAASEVEIHSGQLRLAYRLARTHADTLMHVRGIGWYAWDSPRWRQDETGVANRAVHATIAGALLDSRGNATMRRDVSKCQSDSAIRGILNIASSLPEFAVTAAELDADPYLINLANGTFDLRAMELRAPDPVDLITKVCNGSYHPDAPAGVWDGFLRQMLPDDVHAYMQRLVGVALVGKVIEEVLPILFGSGGNGKSKWAGAVLHALGDYADTPDPKLFTVRRDAHPVGEVDLRGLRLVTISETSKDKGLDEETVKRLTGGDMIRARGMYKSFVSFKPSHLPMLLTNHLPTISGEDKGIWRRLRVVPFTVSIPDAEQDGHLDEKLEAAADEVVTSAIHGYAEYVRIGGLAEPQAVLDATRNYREGEGKPPIDAFILDRVLIKPKRTEVCVYCGPKKWCAACREWEVTVDALYGAWVLWLGNNGYFDVQVNTAGFGKMLKAAVPSLERVRLTMPGSTERPWGYRGARLRVQGEVNPDWEADQG